MKNPEQQVNDLFKRVPAAFRFTPGANYDRSGDDVTQSPIWVRPKSLEQDKIDGFTQVVGHTQHKKITFTDGLIFIDTLDNSNEYLEIVNGQFKVRMMDEVN